MNRKGSALVEFAVLLPVYVLLLVGLIFFANEIVFWQEAQMAARFLATNDRGPVSAPAGTQSPLIAVTSGPAVPQDYFLMGQMQGQPQFLTDSQPGTFTQEKIREDGVAIRTLWQILDQWVLGLVQQGRATEGSPCGTTGGSPCGTIGVDNTSRSRGNRSSQASRQWMMTGSRRR